MMIDSAIETPTPTSTFPPGPRGRHSHPIEHRCAASPISTWPSQGFPRRSVVISHRWRLPPRTAALPRRYGEMRGLARTPLAHTPPRIPRSKWVCSWGHCGWQSPLKPAHRRRPAISALAARIGIWSGSDAVRGSCVVGLPAGRRAFVRSGAAILSESRATVRTRNSGSMEKATRKWSFELAPARAPSRRHSPVAPIRGLPIQCPD
jgi:hypothetical protein